MGGCESSPDDVYEPRRGRWYQGRSPPGWHGQTQRVPIGGSMYRGDPMMMGPGSMYGGPPSQTMFAGGGGGMPPPGFSRSYGGGDFYGGGGPDFYPTGRYGGGGFR